MPINSLSFPQYSVDTTVDPSTWSSLSKLGDVYRNAQSDALKQQTLSQLGPDMQANANLLISSGHPELATTGLALQNRLQEQALQQAQGARAERSTVIQESQEERAAKADEQNTPTWRAKNLVTTLGPDAARTLEGQAYIMGPGYKGPTPTEFEIKDVNGVPYRIKKQGPEGPAVSGDITPANPFAPGGKGMTQDQALAATYSDRMAQSHDTLNQMEAVNQGILGGAATGTVAEVARDIPHGGAVRNWFLSADRQKLEQSQRNFVNALLRKESGAAISQPEFENARQQYFPQPGDSEDVIALKQQNRLTAIRGLAREAGPNYHPPQSIIPPELRRPTTGMGDSYDEALRLARNDIANRVPRAAVEARLKAQGVDPADLDKVLQPPQAPQKSAKTVTKTGTVMDGPNKGKTVVLYSDGTREYQ